MYENATKQTWRGWAWNQIKDRAGKGRVCVLAGDIAGDLEHARRRKMECVAIDMRQECVDRFRKSGGVAVKDGLHDQLLAIQPNALIADFCGGFTASSIAIAADACGICDAVVVNMLRGRDKGRDWGETTVPHYKGRNIKIEHVGKHRGKMMLLGAAKIIAIACGLIDRDEIIVPQVVVDIMRPSFYSYRSKDGGQYFDSVAMSTKGFLVPHEGLHKMRMVAPQKSRRLADAARAVLSRRANAGNLG